MGGRNGGKLTADNNPTALLRDPLAREVLGRVIDGDKGIPRVDIYKSFPGKGHDQIDSYLRRLKGAGYIGFDGDSVYAENSALTYFRRYREKFDR
ncbi:MAG: hypothetical protein JW727_01525 [Candidatus Aenigmarchaeota archaeon]|nr:hypothetical protein [Candidatus Aenigmarchaeota archaeon]